MEYLLQRLERLQLKLQSFESLHFIKWLKTNLAIGFSHVRCIGFTQSLSHYQKRKLGIFNTINLMQIIAGTLIPVIGLAGNPRMGISGLIVACLPSLVSLLVFYLNQLQKYELALLFYFILYPVFTQFVYLNGINLGSELYFIFYGLLSVFLLQNVGYMLMCIAFSMVPYFIISVLAKEVQFSLANENKGIYIFNQAVAILFIFYGLFLIKNEMTGYQSRILKKHKALQRKNLKIEQQKVELQAQAATLSELNALKNKLFSVISHDLKAPMYALRTLFRSVQQYDIPAVEVKKMVPDVLNDLNYTIGLMENMLAWTKSQMQGHSIKKENFDIGQVIVDVIHLLRLPAEAKQLSMEQHMEGPVMVYADKEMTHLILRNLISNAIKFTPQCGTIKVGAMESDSFAEIFVQDNGKGISSKALEMINSKSFYTTKGTESESGTGLGLMLCREFLQKNEGKMHIESKEGDGSTFSFTLPMMENLKSSAKRSKAFN
jgi:two-component system sensor histidine kinase/response regulator